MPRTPRRFICIVSCLLAGGLAACHSDSAEKNSDPSVFHGKVIERFPEESERFVFMDTSGTPRRLSDWRGKTLLIFFGYTHCPDVCPTALARAARAVELLGRERARAQVLFVTLDPERDTPEVLAAYVPAFHPDFQGLSVPTEKLPDLARAFRLFYRKVPGSDGVSYSVDHSALTYLFDSRGRPRLALDYRATPEDLAEDARRLLNEGA
ncbi:MAG: SCO family protein [Zoogloeaceae bacterium]|nr:SCO family protein [Zoogloeaceae bacterium]